MTTVKETIKMFHPDDVDAAYAVISRQLKGVMGEIQTPEGQAKATAILRFGAGGLLFMRQMRVDQQIQIAEKAAETEATRIRPANLLSGTGEKRPHQLRRRMARATAQEALTTQISSDPGTIEITPMKDVNPTAVIETAPAETVVLKKVRTPQGTGSIEISKAQKEE